MSVPQGAANLPSPAPASRQQTTTPADLSGPRGISRALLSHWVIRDGWRAEASPTPYCHRVRISATTTNLLPASSQEKQQNQAFSRPHGRSSTRSHIAHLVYFGHSFCRCVCLMRNGSVACCCGGAHQGGHAVVFEGMPSLVSVFEPPPSVV